MQVSKASIAAIHGMVYLANIGNDTPVDVSKIADELGIPQGYLAKIFQRIARAQLVYSVRGPRGGYRLALPPKEINLLNIIESVDGPVVTGRCELGYGAQCRLFERCKIRRRLDRAKKQANEIYSKITLDLFAGQFEG